MMKPVSPVPGMAPSAEQADPEAGLAVTPADRVMANLVGQYLLDFLCEWMQGMMKTGAIACFRHN